MWCYELLDHQGRAGEGESRGGRHTSRAVVICAARSGAGALVLDKAALLPSRCELSLKRDLIRTPPACSTCRLFLFSCAALSV